MELTGKWNPSHGIAPNDAILDATALTKGSQIQTLNLKHYPMRDIVMVGNRLTIDE